MRDWNAGDTKLTLKRSVTAEATGIDWLPEKEKSLAGA